MYLNAHFKCYALLLSLYSGRKTIVEFSVNITCNDECIPFEDLVQLRREIAENRLVSVELRIGWCLDLKMYLY